MTHDTPSYPAPETVLELEDIEQPPTMAPVIVRLRLVVGDAIKQGVFTEEEGVGLLRWIDSAD